MLHSPRLICSVVIAFTTVIAIINFASTGKNEGTQLKSSKGIAPKGIHYDMSRDPMVFGTRKGRNGEVYDRKMKLKLVTEIPLGKSNFKKQFDMTMDAKETIEDLGQDSQTVENNFFHFTRTQDSVTNDKKSNLSCDTTIARNEAEVACLDLYDMLGRKKYVVNGDGTIVLHEKKEGEKSNSVADLGSKQLQQIVRLLKHIPSELAVKAGDVWDASADMGDRGKLSATGTLLGYVDYEGFDCAAIDIKGTLAMESEQVMATMGGTIASAIASQVSVPDDATIHTIMYYDYKNGLLRWSSTTMSMVITVMQKSGYGLTMPITEIIESSSRIEGEMHVEPLVA